MENRKENHAAKASTKAAEIANQMTLGKTTVEKIKAIHDDDKIVEAVGKITKPRMASILMMYGKTVRIQTSKETLRLDCIFALNALGVLKNDAVV